MMGLQRSAAASKKFTCHFSTALLASMVALLLAACVTTGTGPDERSPTISGYLDYSYDKNSVLFNIRDAHRKTVFFDTFYPFDPSLRYNNAEALVRYELDHAPFMQNGVLMVALDDLARIYGEKDFRIYDVHAYNQKPADLVSVKTVLFNHVSVNIKPGQRFLRVGGSIHAGDTMDGKTRVPTNDPRIDKRQFSVPVEAVNGKMLVPAAEFMQLFERRIHTE